MKFRDFLLKRLLADTDYLVGYAADGTYIRISKTDLATSVATAAQGAVPTVTIQYSADGSSWHDTYAAGDIYWRVKVGSTGGATLKIGMSAYDVWLAQGHSGSEADFLDWLKGADGQDIDASGLRIQDISGYAEFLQGVNDAIVRGKASIIEEVTNTAVTNVMNQFTELNLADIKEIKTLSEDDFITVVTSEGLRKVRIGSFSDNVAVRTVTTRVLESSINTQLQVLTVSGTQDGSNVDYTVREAYVAGTQMLFLNGQLLTHNTDYKVTVAGFTMLTYTPEAGDELIFMGVPK